MSERFPVRIKVYGGSLSLLPPGTTWRVDRITEHVAPGGVIGEVMPEWTLIDLAPVEPETPAPLDVLARKMADRLANIYRAEPVEMARLCDEAIDRSGNLLGWLREYARLRTPEPSE